MAAPETENSSLKDKKLDNHNGRDPPSYIYDESRTCFENRDELDELGPLPPKWEKLYTEDGEVYFIDHNTGTSHWLDPRLSKVRKKSAVECSEDELPYGWERIDDPVYGTYYIDHVNRQTQYENPVLQAKCQNSDSGVLKDSTIPVNDERIDRTFNPIPSMERISNDFIDTRYEGNRNVPRFTRNPDELVGERIQSTLVKSYRGLGFTIVGGDDNKEEYLQIKSVVENGPAWYEGKLQQGDILVYVNDSCVLGYTHRDMVSVFQSIAAGETVHIEVCRGYLLPFDVTDPNAQVVTTVAVGNADIDLASYSSYLTQELLDERRDSIEGDINDFSTQSVKSMPDLYSSERVANIARPTSTDLILDDRRKPQYLTMSLVKGSAGFGFTIADSSHGQKVKKILDKQRCENLQEGDVLVAINDSIVRNMCHSDVVQVLKDCPYDLASSVTVERYNGQLQITAMDNHLRKDSLHSKNAFYNFQNHFADPRMRCTSNYSNCVNYDRREYTRSVSPASESNKCYWMAKNSPTRVDVDYPLSDALPPRGNYYNGDTPPSDRLYNRNYICSISDQMKKLNVNFDYDYNLPPFNDAACYLPSNGDNSSIQPDYVESTVTIHRHDTGFGFRIVGGTEEGSQVSIGHIVEGGAAERDGNLQSGDEIISVDNQSVINASHHQVIQLMGKAALNGKVTLRIRRNINPKGSYHMVPEVQYPYDVTVTRNEDEGFGFVIISSTNKAGSTIGRIIEGSPADRCGQLRVGDNIIAVNHVNIGNFMHGDVVNLIKESGYIVTLTIGQQIDDAESTTSMTLLHKEEESQQYHAVELTRGPRGFGFSIRGGKEFQNMALFVLQIAENGPAALDGRLKVGDKLIEINGVNAKNMTHAQAIEIVRNGGPTVRLLIQRGCAIPSLPMPIQDCDNAIPRNSSCNLSRSTGRLSNEGMENGRIDNWSGGTQSLS